MLNVLASWQAYESGALAPGARLPRPFKSIVELTRNCNFRCVMCPQSFVPEFATYRPELNMSEEIFRKVADELFPYATFVDLRGFGETTILPYWPSVVEELERHPFVEWHLVTNLSLPRPETWRKMIRTGFTLGFSCDGATKETFEAIRGRSRFGTILSNLEVVGTAIREERKGYLYFISTVQRRNFGELRAIVELAARHEVSEVQFKWVHPLGHAEGIEDLEESALAAQVSSAVDAGLDLGVSVTFNDWRFLRGVDAARAREAARPRRAQAYTLPEIPEGEEAFWESHGLKRVFDAVHDSSRVSVHRRCFKPFHFAYVDHSGRIGTCNHMMFPDTK
ncbi:MAG TPA: radical SAM protein, partial [Bdellovibrionota bacterium]|nr:radical SAM protein [Bdellovibrionota bacterium]